MRGSMTRRHRWLAPIALVFAALLPGCKYLVPSLGAGSANPGSSAGPTATPPSSESPDGSPVAGATEPPPCAQATLDAMTLPQRVGQLFMVKVPTVAVGDSIRSAIE